MLLGREREGERIENLLESVRAGRANALVLRGEAGVGKTALLDHAARRAHEAGMRVVRAHGLESEAEMAFGALLLVCRPLLAHIRALPGRQADALRSALALAAPADAIDVPDRLTIGAATLSLLSAAAETRPLLLIVDDANWLDGPSAGALLFAARRLEADSVGILLAARELEPNLGHHGLEELELGGVDDAAARGLVRHSAPAVSPAVADLLVSISRGNPLALLELPRTLTDAQLRGEVALEDPLRLGSRLEQAFAHRALRLGENARRALLVAAASDTDDLRTIADALAKVELDGRALEPAEDAGLVRIEPPRLEFRHPLVRSAVYHGAAASERRAAHRSLAAALAGRDEERRAWHRAAAAIGHDEEAASLLEATARRSRERAAYGVAAAAAERAARLGDDDRRGARLRLAADAAWLAGEPARASRLVQEALVSTLDPEARGELLALRARIELHTGDQRAAYTGFLEAVELVEPTSPDRAAEILGEAVSAGIQTAGPELAALVVRLQQARSAHDPFVELALAQALVMAASVGGFEEGHERLLSSLAAVDDGGTRPESPLELFLSARAYWIVGRNADASSLAREGVRRVRDADVTGLLPQLLRLVAVADYDRGDWGSARAAAAEAAELSEELGQTTTLCACLGLLAELEAAVGDAEACEAHAARASEIGIRLGLAFYRERAERALGHLRLIRGELEAAASQLEEVASRLARAENHELNVTPLPDLVEVYVRLGALDQAGEALERLESLTQPSVHGESALIERSRGLAAPDAAFSDHFVRAVDLHRADLFPFELARTQLCFGERLRRTGERRAAREQLAAAAKTFEALGAVPWLRRAHDELRASGQRLRRQGPGERDVLTPREAQIANQVGQGKSNREVAAALYLTPKTVEFHLTRVYRKLGVRSRAELVRMLAERTLETEGRGRRDSPPSSESSLL
jgi:DNA-binding CsgD family transcriptional regulator